MLDCGLPACVNWSTDPRTLTLLSFETVQNLRGEVVKRVAQKKRSARKPGEGKGNVVEGREREVGEVDWLGRQVRIGAHAIGQGETRDRESQLSAQAQLGCSLALGSTVFFRLKVDAWSNTAETSTNTVSQSHHRRHPSFPFMRPDPTPSLRKQGTGCRSKSSSTRLRNGSASWTTMTTTTTAAAAATNVTSTNLPWCQHQHQPQRQQRQQQRYHHQQHRPHQQLREVSTRAAKPHPH